MQLRRCLNSFTRLGVLWRCRLFASLSNAVITRIKGFRAGQQLHSRFVGGPYFLQYIVCDVADTKRNCSIGRCTLCQFLCWPGISKPLFNGVNLLGLGVS